MKPRFTILIATLYFTTSTPAQFRDGVENIITDTGTLRLYKNKIPVLSGLGAAAGLARTYKLIADYYHEAGQTDSLLAYYKLALKQYEQVKDSFHISYCYFRIGEHNAWSGKDLDASLAWHLPAAGYFERAGEYHMAAFSHYAISTVYRSKQQLQLEGQYFNKAVAFNKLAKDTLLDIIMLGTDFTQLRKEKKWDILYDKADKMVQLSRLINQPVFIKVGLLQMGNSLLHRGFPARAVPLLEESHQVNARTDAAHAEALRLLAICHVRLNNAAESEKYIALYKLAADSLARIKENDNYHEMLVKFETEKKQATIKNLEQENELKGSVAANQRNLIIALFAILSVLIIAGWIVLRNIRKRQKLEKQLHWQQEQFAKQLQLESENKLLAEFSKQLAEVQLSALSAQMNPHFIFNCMNSIQKYVLKNEKTKVLEFLQHFSDLMRSVLDNSTKIKIGLDEEIGMLEKYILLEQQRLDSQFDYRIEITPDLQTDFFEIPGMIIQPYVENAIWHGLMNKPGKGVLTLKFEKEGSLIKCVVEDDGVGRQKASEIDQYRSPKRKSYGMAIAQKRLELLQREKITTPKIIIEDLYKGSQPAGTRVTIFIVVE